MVASIHARLKGAGAAAAAAVVAAGLVSAPPERSDTSVTRAVAAQVQLQAAVTQIAGLVSSAPHPAPAAAASPTAAATASETASDPYEGLRTFLTSALLPVGLVIAPFWYLGALITYPLYTQIRQAITGVYQPGIFGLLNWLIAPFSLADLVFPRPSPVATTSATVRPVPARSAAATADVVVSPNEPAAVGVAASEPAAVGVQASEPVISTQPETVKRSASRSVAVQVEAQLQADTPVSVPSRSAVSTASRDGREPAGAADERGAARGAARTADRIG